MNKKVIQEFIIKKSKAGLRLDIFLSEITGFSRSQIQKMVKNLLIMVNENIVTSSGYILSDKDKVLVLEQDKKTSFNVETIYEDKDILVINKPAGITVHPAPGEKDITISELFSDKYKGGKDERDTIIHRLDKGTSGVMVLAKNENSRNFLQEQFAKRKVIKKYIALVGGKISPKEGLIDMPLARDFSSRNRIAPFEEGREAKTLYKVLRYYCGYTLVSANPKTGRTHQIRVHFAALGHPLYGDTRYGFEETKDRIFLHAAEISFIHPTTGKRVKYSSDLPDELENILGKLSIE